MRKEVHKAETKRKKIKRDLPDSYYDLREVPLDRRELESLLTQHYDYLLTKIELNVRTQLEIITPRDVVAGALGDITVAMLRQFEAGKVQFWSPGLFIAYLLRSGWRTLTAENRKKTQKVWSGNEGDFGHLEQRFVALDTIAEPAASPQTARGSLDLRDDYQTQLWTDLWEQLADAVAAGKLQFRDVAIYKHYVLHKYVLDSEFTIAAMVAEREFGRKQIVNALKVMKAYVQEYVATMKRPSDNNCEEEAEDIFGY